MTIFIVFSKARKFLFVLWSSIISIINVVLFFLLFSVFFLFVFSNNQVTSVTFQKALRSKIRIKKSGEIISLFWQFFYFLLNLFLFFVRQLLQHADYLFFHVKFWKNYNISLLFYLLKLISLFPLIWFLYIFLQVLFLSQMAVNIYIMLFFAIDFLVFVFDKLITKYRLI